MFLEELPKCDSVVKERDASQLAVSLSAKRAERIAVETELGLSENALIILWMSPKL